MTSDRLKARRISKLRDKRIREMLAARLEQAKTLRMIYEWASRPWKMEMH